MASSKQTGLIDCPLCGNNQATVHQQQTGTKKGRYYYRCYESPGSNVMQCGTIQCIGPKGQEFILANMRPLPGESIAQAEPPPPAQEETPAAPIAQEETPAEPIGQEEPEQPPAKGWLNSLLGDDDDE